MGLFSLFKRRAKQAETPADALQQAEAPAQVETPADTSTHVGTADVAAPVSVEPPSAEEPHRLVAALNRTKLAFARVLHPIAGLEADDAFFDEMEESLIAADVGVALAREIAEAVRKRSQDLGYSSAGRVRDVLRAELASILASGGAPQELAPDRLAVILLVGVNGVGKTTVAAKLANLLRLQGYSSILASADTYRAAAQEQLDIWAKRIGVPIVEGEMGADPSSVIFNAVRSAKASGAACVIADTAGRLQTKGNLMQELGKMARTAAKADPDAQVINLLVVDAGTGQNALSQAALFGEVCPLSGIVLTKIDGTAKGGIVFPLVRAHRIPVVYLTMGEKADDIAEFDAESFARAMTD
jgi:fused signal recognition particle receptor